MLVAKAPLRISLFGGGTDIPSYIDSGNVGTVISMAINRYVYCALHERFDDGIWLGYSKKEIIPVPRVDLIKNELIRECFMQAGVAGGVELAYMSDIPSWGSGLGSSSSFCIATLAALHSFRGEDFSRASLAHGACLIEIENMGKPIGLQDQYAAAHGGLRVYTFHRGYVTTHGSRIEHEKLLDHMLLFWAGDRDESAEKILGDQGARAVENKNTLDEIAHMVPKAHKMILEGDIEEVGRMLEDYWKLKKTLAFGVSPAWVDKIHRKVMQSGAWGMKLCGAGGGGFMLVMAPRACHAAIEAAVQLKRVRFGIDQLGARVVFHEGA